MAVHSSSAYYLREVLEDLGTVMMLNRHVAAGYNSRSAESLFIANVYGDNSGESHYPEIRDLK